MRPVAEGNKMSARNNLCIISASHGKRKEEEEQFWKSGLERRNAKYVF